MNNLDNAKNTIRRCEKNDNPENQTIADCIFHDIADRGGLKNYFFNIDDDTLEDIKETWNHIIELKIKDAKKEGEE